MQDREKLHRMSKVKLCTINTLSYIQSTVSIIDIALYYIGDEVNNS